MAPHLSEQEKAERAEQKKAARLANQETRGNARRESIEALPPTQRREVKRVAAVRFNRILAWRAVSR
jgi:hypothetical protein